MREPAVNRPIWESSRQDDVSVACRRRLQQGAPSQLGDWVGGGHGFDEIQPVPLFALGDDIGQCVVSKLKKVQLLEPCGVQKEVFFGRVTHIQNLCSKTEDWKKHLDDRFFCSSPCLPGLKANRVWLLT
jgi:hypothetical protein